jgi:hypothetical protein
MSFDTTLQYYRPTEPPRVTGADLARFVRGFHDLKLVDEDGRRTVQVKFGEAIDQDERPTSWNEPVNNVVSVSREIEWDLNDRCESLQAAADWLAEHPRPVYRAYLDLGLATDEVFEHLRRIDSPENDVNLLLDSWSLEIGPVESHDIEAQRVFHVGWISVEISGHGYLYPWTFAELVQRAEDHPSLRRLTEFCRTVWPVRPLRPNGWTRRGRKRMGELWPYRELDRPWDWFWGLCESG